MLHGLISDQNRHFVSPDLGPNCLQKLLADNTEKEHGGSQRYLGKTQTTSGKIFTASRLLLGVVCCLFSKLTFSKTISGT